MADPVATHAPKDSGAPAFARDFSVKGRVVIVTGAGQGIGRELARQFAAAGAIAVVADLNPTNAAAVVAEIEAAGGQGFATTVDIASRESAEAMAAAVKAKYGRVDALINNAGIFATLNKRAFDQIPQAEWDLVIKVNITGIFNCVCAVAQTMRDQRYGRIINMSSDSVHKGTMNYLHYVTSKSAVIGMTNSLARELGPHGITVNAIRPGSVATEVERTHNPTTEIRQRNADLQCIPRGMLPTDLVGLTMFLTTNAASFITGQTIACDGGYTHSF
jgi:3-oxoacyl-[acyl-carrier protein] reductase